MFLWEGLGGVYRLLLGQAPVKRQNGLERNLSEGWEFRGGHLCLGVLRDCVGLHDQIHVTETQTVVSVLTDLARSSDMIEQVCTHVAWACVHDAIDFDLKSACTVQEKRSRTGHIYQDGDVLDASRLLHLESIHFGHVDICAVCRMRHRLQLVQVPLRQLPIVPIRRRQCRKRHEGVDVVLLEEGLHVVVGQCGNLCHIVNHGLEAVPRDLVEDESVGTQSENRFGGVRDVELPGKLRMICIHG